MLFSLPTSSAVSPACLMWEPLVTGGFGAPDTWLAQIEVCCTCKIYTGFWKLIKKISSIISRNCTSPEYFGYTVFFLLVSFYILKMWLLENVKVCGLHSWLTWHFYFRCSVSAGLENTFLKRWVATITCVDAVTLRSVELLPLWTHNIKVWFKNFPSV